MKIEEILDLMKDQTVYTTALQLSPELFDEIKASFLKSNMPMTSGINVYVEKSFEPHQWVEILSDDNVRPHGFKKENSNDK